MREFDRNKPFGILGIGDTQYLVQDGRKYLPKKNAAPQLLKEQWAKRTADGGQIYNCRFCGGEFEEAHAMGRHYRETECGRKKYQYKIWGIKERKARVTLAKILGAENDVKDGQVKEETG